MTTPADDPAAAAGPAPLDLERVAIRGAQSRDLPAVVQLLADDPLGAARENPALPLPAAYLEAFAAIARDPNNELIVADLNGAVVGVLQLTFIPCLTHRGSWRAMVAGVRVASGLRSRGIGRRLFLWTIARARQRGCGTLQLLSDKSRTDAIRFYRSLGFADSHEGLKLNLAAAGGTEPDT